MEITKRQIWFALAAIGTLSLIPLISSKVLAASGLDDDVKLLLHGNVGDNIVTTLRDSSFSAHTVTLNGDAKRALDKFSQSGFFDDSGDYLSVPSSSDWDFWASADKVTIDGWIKTTGSIEPVATRWTSSSFGSGSWGFYVGLNTAGRLEIFHRESSGTNQGPFVFGGSGLNDGNWHHVAYVKDGTNHYLFADGVVVGTKSESFTGSTNSAALLIAADTFSSGPRYFGGNLEELRISKGIARWTSNFTPPTSPYTSDGNTSLLLHMDGTPGSTTFTDSSGSPKTVTANGNAVISSFSKFGGDGISFDGSGDYVTIPANADFNFGTNSFTIDFWINFRTTARQYLFDIGSNGANFVVTPSSGLIEMYGPSSYVINSGSTPFSVGTWYHIALVRNGNAWTVYRDGTSYVTATDSRSWGSSSVTLSICQYGGGSYNCGAYIDEFRISKGVARWTSNFTPPTEAYGLGPAITLTGNVKFLRNIAVVGSISKGVGTFVIDHPQKPRTHLLYHSFVESPEAKNIYDGIVELDSNGEATIPLPDYFEALNNDFRYQYFPLDQSMPNLHVKEEVKNNQFVLGGGKPGGRVSWQVTGVRHDPYIEANPIRVEVEKGPGELVDKGECLHDVACI